jgi:hypothetical protein
MMRRRSSDVMELQRAISGTERAHPSQSPVALSMMQTLMQGVSNGTSGVAAANLNGAM